MIAWFRSRVQEYRLEMILGMIFVLIFISGLLLPESDFLEVLFLFHKKAIYSIIFFLVIWETVYLVIGLIKKKPFAILMSHILLCLAAFIIFSKVNLYTYEKVIGAKLAAIEILEPKYTDKVYGGIIDVKVFIRNVRVPVYLVVETPQGTPWVQSRIQIPAYQFKATLTQKARLGGILIDEPQTYRIFAIGTGSKLEVNRSEEIPTDSIVSNIVAVKRVR